MGKILRLNNVVVGNTIITLLYALRTHTHCILEEPQAPFQFSKEFDEFDFSFLGTQDPVEIWDRLCFILGMAGLLLFPDNIQTFRKEVDHYEIITKNNRKTILECNEVIRFDTEKDELVDVYDYFWCRGSGSDNISQLEDAEDSFVKTLLFPERVNQTREAIACSRIASKDLLEFDLSSSMARLKALHMMRIGGVKGYKNGILASGEQSWVPPRLEWEKRLIKHIYYSHMSLREVFELEQQRGYAWKLLENITQFIST